MFFYESSFRLQVIENRLLNSVTSIGGWQYLSLKSKLPASPFKSCSTCVIIYKVTCSCHKRYNGQTGRTIEERIKEHQITEKYEKLVEKITSKRRHDIKEKLNINLIGKKQQY